MLPLAHTRQGRQACIHAGKHTTQTGRYAGRQVDTGRQACRHARTLAGIQLDGETDAGEGRGAVGLRAWREGRVA